MVVSNKLFILILCIISFTTTCINSQTIYEVLKDHGLPMGLLPKGVKDFSLDANGNFEVHLDQPCNAKFENEIHYDKNVSGILSYGQIDGLSGISAQELFLWFPVKEIRVDIPSSGLIYFDVGVVSKQFSLSSFETPRDCIAVELSDLEMGDGKHILEALSKNMHSSIGLLFRDQLFDVRVITFQLIYEQSRSRLLQPKGAYEQELPAVAVL